MAQSPTVSGVFLAGPLNGCNSPKASGQGDAYGQEFPSGITAGQMIEMGREEAQRVAAPGTTLYEGHYMWVKLSDKAAAATSVIGNIAFIQPDSTVPANGDQLGFPVPKVIDSSAAPVKNLISGVFLNPAVGATMPDGTTWNGTDFTPTPNNWLFIFCGGGRVAVNLTGAVLGTPVYVDSATGLPTATAGTADRYLGVAAGPSVGGKTIIYVPNVIYRPKF